jgi:hypothetical protein
VILLMQFFFLRALLMLRGLRYVEREPSRIAQRDLMRIDACSALSSVRGGTEALHSAVFQTRTILLALRAGERQRIAMAMAGELSQTAWGGSKTWKRTQELMELAQDAAVRSGSAKTVAWTTSVCGFAYYLVGQYPRACQLLARGVDVLESQGGRGYEASRPKLFLINALWALGRLKEARGQLPGLLAEADERGELSSLVNLRIGPSNMAWLMADDARGARDNVALAMDRWSKRGFHPEHFYELWARTNIALYEGDPVAASTLVWELLPHYSRSFLRRVQAIRIRTWWMRARCALAMAAAASPASKARADHLRIAERMVRRMSREQMPWSNPSVAFFRAAIARLRGDTISAVALLREAALGFEAEQFALDASVARYFLGRELGGSEGDALMQAATSWLVRQTVQNPARFLAMLAPGFGEARF